LHDPKLKASTSDFQLIDRRIVRILSRDQTAARQLGFGHWEFPGYWALVIGASKAAQQEYLLNVIRQRFSIDFADAIHRFID